MLVIKLNKAMGVITMLVIKLILLALVTLLLLSSSICPTLWVTLVLVSVLFFWLACFSHRKHQRTKFLYYRY